MTLFKYEGVGQAWVRASFFSALRFLLSRFF